MTQIEKKLFEISEVLKINNCSDDSLLCGQSGIAVFFAYLNQKYLNSDLNSAMEKSLQKSLEAFEKSESTYTFCSGYAGICWGLKHLVTMNQVEADVNCFFENIHPYLSSSSETDLQNNYFDFLHGGLGAGIYFLDMLPDKIAKDHILKTIHLLYDNSIFETSDVKWENTIFKSNPKSIKEEYNCGISHGIPNIVWFLSKCYEQKIEQEKCSILINGSVQWILKQKIQDNSISLFPTIVQGNTPIPNSRLAWCYGDLGIAAMLWQAGKVLINEEFKNEAISIMLHASKRRNLEENLVNDAGLCHGTAGIAHVFNRFYWETRNPVFKETANYWIQETLKMAYHKDGLAGYKSWNGRDTGWLNNYGLLEGIAGIGLVLYSHLSDEEPKWDRCLLLS